MVYEMKMHGKEIILLIAFLTIMIIVPELAKASPDINFLEGSYVFTARSPDETFTRTSLSENVSEAANMLKIADDTLYLRRDWKLTTAAPTSATAATISAPTGSSTTVRWINETAVPGGYNWTIPSGSYNFIFWMRRTGGVFDYVIAIVTFTFGYVKPDGTEISIVAGTRSISLSRRVTQYSIIVSGGAMSISPGSKLFIEVSITAIGTAGQSAVFYYDGSRQSTRIITPPISQVVPEFPLGAAFLPSLLLLTYFIFRRGLRRV